MGGPRLSIRKLMGYVLVVGVGVAALSQPNKGWSIVSPALFLTMLLTAILGSVFRRGPKRAFWIGFAFFGWTFLAPTFFWKDDFNNSPISNGKPILSAFVNSIDLFMVLGTKDQKILVSVPNTLRQVDDDSHILVALSVAGLLFGYLGGVIARFLSRNKPASHG